MADLLNKRKTDGVACVDSNQCIICIYVIYKLCAFGGAMATAVTFGYDRMLWCLSAHTHPLECGHCLVWLPREARQLQLYNRLLLDRKASSAPRKSL